MKFIFKEEYTPAHVDQAPVHRWRRSSILAAALAIFAVIPFGSVLPINRAGHRSDRCKLIVAPNVDVGMIYVFALSSMAVYGVILGGWASNNKYSFLGGLRSSAQLIAYEIAAGPGHPGRRAGLRLAAAGRRSSASRPQSGVWNVFAQPLGFVVFLVAAFAETCPAAVRPARGEQELIGGYHTEYAGMQLLLYLIAEFLHMVTAAFLIVILFLRRLALVGHDRQSTSDVDLGHGHCCGWSCCWPRCWCVILFFMMVRWSWPRFRFDQLMTLAWKVMLPLGLVNLVAVAVVIEYRAGHDAGAHSAAAELARRSAVHVGRGDRWPGSMRAASLRTRLSTDNRPASGRRCDRTIDRTQPRHRLATTRKPTP